MDHNDISPYRGLTLGDPHKETNTSGKTTRARYQGTPSRKDETQTSQAQGSPNGNNPQGTTEMDPQKGHLYRGTPKGRQHR
jgi:hypothetical protein